MVLETESLLLGIRMEKTEKWSQCGESRSAVSSCLILIPQLQSLSASACSVVLLFNNAGKSPVKDYWTSLKVKADDLFDLVKSDSAFAGSIFSFHLTARLHFNSSRCLFLLLSTTFCQLFIHFSFTPLCFCYLSLHCFLFSKSIPETSQSWIFCRTCRDKKVNSVLALSGKMFLYTLFLFLLSFSPFPLHAYTW